MLAFAMLCSTKRLLMNQLVAPPVAFQASLSFGRRPGLLFDHLDTPFAPDRKFTAKPPLTNEGLQSRATGEAGFGKSLQRVLQTGWKDIRRRSFQTRNQLQFGVPNFSAPRGTAVSLKAAIFSALVHFFSKAVSPADVQMEEKIQPHIVLLSGDPKKDYDGLLRDIGDAQVVLIGEASHGTHDFYEERAKITKMLVEEKGFSMVVCEADWPDMARAHRYVRGLKGDGSAAEALEGFKRFPTWMWRNTVMVDFVEWAKKHNQEVFAEERAGEKLENTSSVGLYGFDLYSLHKSMESVIEYLEKVDPDAAERTKKRYSCFDHFGRDPQLYGLATTAGGADPCEDQVVKVLKDIMQTAPDKLRAANHDRDATCHEDEQFFAVQNALVVKDAEQYYRSMYRARDNSWNLRDKHMFNTLKALIAHCERLSGRPARAVVWAHNSHLGDARATDMSWRRKELNVGQLVREHYKEKAFNIGFSTYTGTVTAAYDWGEPAHCMKVNQGMAGSFERLFHKVSPSRFLLDVSTHVPKHLELLERAIGVIYRADTERFSHYFQARVAQQFNRVIHLDWTRALEPLEWGETWNAPKDEPPETYPFGE